MQFKFKVSKLANFYFFISNLSEWHFACRPNYNKIWLKETGPLSKKELLALNKFKNILKNYGFTSENINDSKYLGKFFYLNSEKECWKKLKKSVNEEEFNEIRNIFETFRPRFEKIWQKAIRSERVKIFQKEIRKNQWKSLFEDLPKIFGNKNKTFKIIIIFSPLDENETAAGNATLGSISLILELPQCKENSWQLTYSVCVFAHEIAHILFESRGGRKLIKKIVGNFNLSFETKNFSPSIINIVEEAVIESFLPLGYLGQKYSQFQLAPFLLNNLDRAYQTLIHLKKGKVLKYRHQLNYYLIWQLYPLAIIYGRAKKKIDENYIIFVLNTIKDLIKKGGLS